MGGLGIEPRTSSTSRKRSPAELPALCVMIPRRVEAALSR